MLDLLREKIKNKNVLILGFGREGKSTYKRICEVGGYNLIAIADKNSISADLPCDVKIICGENYQKVINEYDIVFKSPGVVLENPFESYNCVITSQTEIFIQRYSSQIIGITGTKGKSTTTTLIYHIMSENSVDSVLTGNIGIPSFDVIDDIKDTTKVVFELSCHQLENIKFSPSYAIFLNLFEEHLDHYGSFEKYASAKKNIYKHQNQESVLICNSDILPDPSECLSKVISCSQSDKNSKIYIDNNIIHYNGETVEIDRDRTSLVGKHNYYNIGIAYALCRIIGLSTQQIMNAVYTYQPLPHRLEYIGESEGVKYYDDSISTICAAAIQAVTSLRDVDTVIIGGMDRGIDYSELIEFLSGCSVSNIILMSDSGKRIYNEIKQRYTDDNFLNKIRQADKLDEAVILAKRYTAKGKTCVMSPAAASYNDFKNFEERGDAFKKYVFTV